MSKSQKARTETSTRNLQERIVEYFRLDGRIQTADLIHTAKLISFQSKPESLPQTQEAAESVLTEHHLQFGMHLHQDYFVYLNPSAAHQNKPELEIGILVRRSNNLITYEIYQSTSDIPVSRFLITIHSDQHKDKISLHYDIETTILRQIVQEHLGELRGKALACAVHAALALNTYLKEHPEDIHELPRPINHPETTDNPAFIDILLSNPDLDNNIRPKLEESEVYNISKLITQSDNNMRDSKGRPKTNAATDLQQWNSFKLPHNPVTIEIEGHYGHSAWLLSQLEPQEFKNINSINPTLQLDKTEKLSKIIIGEYFTDENLQKPTALLTAYLNKSGNLIKIQQSNHDPEYTVFQLGLSLELDEETTILLSKKVYSDAWHILRFLGLLHDGSIRLTTTIFNPHRTKSFVHIPHSVQMVELKKQP